MPINYRKEILRKILDEFQKFISGLGHLAFDMAVPAYSQLRIDGFSRRRYYYYLNKFEKNGLLKKVQKNKRIVYVISDRAVKLGKKPSQKILRSDKLSSIIMFDIPESKRNARDSFRRYLLRNGYTQIQKSVFISPFKVFPELNELIAEMDVRKYITVVSGKIDRL